MSAGIYDIRAEQYATFRLELTWLDAAAAAVDLTGFTALMQVRDDADTLILELSTGNGRIALGGAAGTVALAVPADVMQALPAPGPEWNYDLLLTGPAPGLEVTALLRGKFTVAKGITQPPP